MDGVVAFDAAVEGGGEAPAEVVQEAGDDGAEDAAGGDAEEEVLVDLAGVYGGLDLFEDEGVSAKSGSRRGRSLAMLRS